MARLITCGFDSRLSCERVGQVPVALKDGRPAIAGFINRHRPALHRHYERRPPLTIRVGTILYGYCGGYFGRDSYHDKRVEAIGADWVVVRVAGANYDDTPEFFTGDPEVLEQYTVPNPDSEF